MLPPSRLAAALALTAIWLQCCCRCCTAAPVPHSTLPARALQTYTSNCPSAADNVTGQCVTYPMTGVCAPYLGNMSVWVPQGRVLEDVEATVITQVRAARNNAEVTGPVCALLTQAFVCGSRFPLCQASASPTYPAEDIPILPCDDFCTLYWDVCRSALELYGTDAVKGDFVHSTLPNCLPTTSPTPRPGTFLGGNAQPPDLIGGRAFIGGAPRIRGLLGVLLYPSDYNYTYADGQSVAMQCWDPPSNLTAELNFTLSCFDPYVPSGDSNCALPCPFPLFDAEETSGIQIALLVPGVLGLVLCLFVTLDSLWIIAESRNIVLLRWPGLAMPASSSAGHTTATAEPPRARTKPIRSSTYYALLGGVLGITYFLIGVLPTFLYGPAVSCSQSTIDPGAILSGTAPPDPTSCGAQRASPFVLQAMFNLVLYAMVSVFFRIDQKFKSLSESSQRALQALLWAYCAGVPLVALIVSFALDKLSEDLFVAASQLARQATMCQLRLLPEVVEIVLLDLPFIVTGVLICVASLVILVKIVWITNNATHGQKEVVSNEQLSPAALTYKVKSSQDHAMQQLIQRLAFLGLSTFVVLIVFMSATGVFQSQLETYGPLFQTYSSCQTQGFACLDCAQYKTEALAQRPSAGTMATQLASMASVVLLFGGFFTLQSVARLRQEHRDGSLQQKLKRVFVVSSADSAREYQVSAKPMSSAESGR